MLQLIFIEASRYNLPLFFVYGLQTSSNTVPCCMIIVIYRLQGLTHSVNL
jgi:hypothetical protein